MSESSIPLFPSEVQNYLLSCENLLFIGANTYKPPFSTDELDIMKYYAKELAEMVSKLKGWLAQQSAGGARNGSEGKKVRR